MLGYYADFIFLAGEVRQVAPEDARTLSVLETWLDGQGLRVREDS